MPASRLRTIGATAASLPVIVARKTRGRRATGGLSVVSHGADESRGICVVATPASRLPRSGKWRGEAGAPVGLGAAFSAAELVGSVERPQRRRTSTLRVDRDAGVATTEQNARAGRLRATRRRSLRATRRRGPNRSRLEMI